MQVIPSMTKSECMYALHWIDRLCVRSKNKECVFLSRCVVLAILHLVLLHATILCRALWSRRNMRLLDRVGTQQVEYGVIKDTFLFRAFHAPSTQGIF